jgi:phage gp36-like protein
MAYCTQADLEKSYTLEVLKQIGGDGTTIDSDYVSEAIADADGLIDAYLCTKYSVPLTTVPQIINTISKKISFYYLMLRTPGGDQSAELDYNNSIQLLEKISSGVMLLPGTSESSGLELVDGMTDTDRGDYDYPLHDMSKLHG